MEPRKPCVELIDPMVVIPAATGENSPMSESEFVRGMDSKNSLLHNFEMIDDEMADILRQKTGQERLRIAGRMWKSARTMLRGAIQTEHPDWDVDQVNREIARRISHGVVGNEPH